MKKYLSIILIIALSGLLASCNFNLSTSSNNKDLEQEESKEETMQTEKDKEELQQEIGDETLEPTQSEYFDFENGFLYGFSDTYIDLEDRPTDIVFPEEINGKTVEVLVQNGFADYELTSIVIPDTILYVENFSICDNNLTQITIPNNLDIMPGSITDSFYIIYQENGQKGGTYTSDSQEGVWVLQD